MVEALSIGVVGTAGIYLLILGLGAIIVPKRATTFLHLFASTQTLHFFEILCRVIVGASLIVAAPTLSPALLFSLLGWLLLGTSGVLLVIPWRWHQQFASKTVPVANRYIGLIGFFSLVGGCVILVAVFRWIAT